MRHIDQVVIDRAIVAHEAIHNPSKPKTVKIGQQVVPIMTHRNGCRYVTLGNYTIMAQNPNKGTKYAARAKAGDKLSWIIPSLPDVAWHLIDSTELDKKEQAG